MDSGRRRTDVVGSDDSTGSGSGGAFGGHGVGRDGCAALPARCGRAEVSSEALHVLGAGARKRCRQAQLRHMHGGDTCNALRFSSFGQVLRARL
jgi:hypothetical protein